MKSRSRDFFKANFFEKKDENDDIDELEGCFFTKKSKTNDGKNKLDNKTVSNTVVATETEDKNIYCLDKEDEILSKYADNVNNDVTSSSHSGMLEVTSKEDNSSISKANDILKSVAEKKRKYIAESSSSSSSVIHNDTNESQYLNISIPIIKTASERRAIAHVNVIDAASSSNLIISPVKSSIKKIKIRTRINGKAHLTWLVPHYLHFNELRKYFATIVACHATAFQFDGESVEGTQSPDDLDMEDDEIVDVKIGKDAVYETVIQAIETKVLDPSAATAMTQSSGFKVTLIEYSNGKTNYPLNICL